MSLDHTIQRLMSFFLVRPVLTSQMHHPLCNLLTPNTNARQSTVALDFLTASMNSHQEKKYLDY